MRTQHQERRTAREPKKVKVSVKELQTLRIPERPRPPVGQRRKRSATPLF